MTNRRSIGMSASEDRLLKLIQERMQPESDKESIDTRIWDLFGEDWCVMFTDLSGFSRGVAKFGIIHFLQTIFESERLFIPIIDRHDGILLKVEADSLLVIFRNVMKSVQTAIDMQKALKGYNSSKVDEEKVLGAIGIGYGRVLRIGDSDVFGSEVNAASKLGEDIGKAGEILVTQSVREKVTNLPGVSFQEFNKVPVGIPKAYKIIYPV